MTIKDWLIIYNIKNLEKGVLELSKLGAPKQLITSYQKQLEDAKKGKLNIMYIDKTKNLDFSKIEVVKVEEVVGPKGGNKHLKFNDNIHLFKARHYSYFKQMDINDTTVKVLYES